MFLKTPVDSDFFPKFDKAEELKKDFIRAALDLYRADETYTEAWEDAYMFFKSKARDFIGETE